MFKKKERGKKPEPVQQNEPVQEIKKSKTIYDLLEICKKSKTNEGQVREAILRNLENEIGRLRKLQSMTDRETLGLVLPIQHDIESLEALGKKLKNGDLASGFNQWVSNNNGTWSEVNKISPTIIESIKQIVQCEFVKSEAKSENSYGKLASLFQNPNLSSNSSSNSNSNSNSSSSPMIGLEGLSALDLEDLGLDDDYLNSLDYSTLKISGEFTDNIPVTLPNNYTNTNQVTSDTLSNLQVFVSPECSNQILASIAGNNDNEFTRFNMTTAQIPANLSSDELLGQIKNRMHEFEQFKYPSPPWTYRRLEPKSENEKVIIKIDFDPSKMPTGKELEKMLVEKEANSLVVRKLSILSGALTLLDYDSFITADPNKKIKIREHITNEVNAIIAAAARKDNPPDIKKNFAAFIDALNADIAHIAEIKKADIEEIVADPIRKAERYFTAEYNKNMVLMTVTHENDSKVVQMDIELNQLTDQQREEYFQIRDDNPPLWFAALMKSEQEWYLKHVPEDMSDTAKWKYFEQMFKSSAMQHAPGLSNARANFGMVQQSDGSIKTLTSGLQSGVPANYEMSQLEMEKHAKENIEQACAFAIKFSKHNYEQLWGDFFEYKPTIPVLFQSLLSSEILVDKADSELIAAQELAMKSARPNLGGYNGHNIMLHNNPTNAYRAEDGLKSNFNAMKAALHSNVSDNAARGGSTWDDSARIRSEAKHFLTKVIEKSTVTLSKEEQKALEVLSCTNQELKADQKNSLMNLIDSNRLPLTDNQKSALRKIVAAENEFRKLEKTQSNFLFGAVRNKEEYKIALKRFLVEAMGGVIINNCKSGKDRTGLSEIYQHAMKHYFNKYGDICSFDAKGTAREQFSKIWSNLFASGKIQGSGGLNTPGSDGTKDDGFSRITDPDLIKSESMSKLHKSSYESAGLNKPPLYTELEKKQKTNRNKIQEIPTPTTLVMK